MADPSGKDKPIPKAVPLGFDPAQPSAKKLPPKPVLVARSQPAAPVVPASPQVPTAGKSAPELGTGFQIATGEEANRVSTYRRQQRAWYHSPGTIALAVVGLCVVGIGSYFAIQLTSHRDLAIRPIEDKFIQELQALEFTVAVEAGGSADEKFTYQLVDAPAGAQIDVQAGKFSWTPTEEQGPATYKFSVRVKSGQGDQTASRALQVHVQEANQPPVFETVDEQAASVGSQLVFKAVARDPDQPARELEYLVLKGSPRGSKVDKKTGEFRWTPDANLAGQRVVVQLGAREVGAGGLNAKLSIEVQVGLASESVAHANPDGLLGALRARGLSVEPGTARHIAPFHPEARILSVEGETVALFDYASRAELEREARQALADAAILGGTTEGVMQLYAQETLLVYYQGQHGKILGGLRSYFGPSLDPTSLVASSEPPVAPDASTGVSNVGDSKVGAANPGEPVPSLPAAGQGDGPAARTDEEGDQVILDLLERKVLFATKNYPALRGVYSARFERDHEQQIRQAFGADHDSVLAWLNEHPEVKEELYLALAPQDDVVAALGLFKEIQRKFADKLADYAELAIAVAVTWDNPKGVYDYSGHQARTHTTMPANKMHALDTFQYLVDSEKLMEGRIQFVPWEFLVHVVNHDTPLAERQWAVPEYLRKRVKIGECYDDVPYDFQMLNTQSQECKLNGKPYTLENLRSFGGVCAMQADFAARVAKSLGVPAEYVRGESRSGDLHAWIMWVELRQVTKNSIAFSLESHGRYQIDKYYVGMLTDPQTGQDMTDRELELRLHTVGLNPRAKRHAELAMRSLPMLMDRAKLDVNDQLGFLHDTLELCPGNTAAWRTLAKMSKDNVASVQQRRPLRQALDKLFPTFARFPDFTWTVFDDLLASVESPKQRNKLFEKLVALYEDAQRPDLACEARLKLTEILVEDQAFGEAVDGLAFTIKKFADEGRYVPRMLDKLESICPNVKDANEKLVQFYQEFLPLVPTKRGNDPSKYCMSMYERGIQQFQQAGQAPLAQAYQGKLQALKSGG